MMTLKTCDLCSSIYFRQIPDSQMTECQVCTIQYPNQIPSSGVVTNQAPISPSGRGPLLARRQARLALKVCIKQSLMDIGCGNGAFLHAFQLLNKDEREVTGVEIDELSIQAALSAGISVVDKIPKDVNNTLITMWHVAEHILVDDLKSILKELSENENLLLISVPNGNSYSWAEHLEKFSYYDPKSHMVQFTPRSLRKLLHETGWHIQREFRTPMYGIFNAIQTGLNLFEPHNELYEFLKREGNSLKPSILFKNLLLVIRAIRPIMLMVSYEFSKEKCSCYTVLSASRRP